MTVLDLEPMTGVDPRNMQRFMTRLKKKGYITPNGPKGFKEYICWKVMDDAVFK